MRAPKRRRPPLRRIVPVPESTDLEEVASRVSYVGSPEHKDAPSFAGHPKPRSDATICDRRFIGLQDQLTAWIQESIRAGLVGGPWEGGFPRYVWCVRDGAVYEARLVNRGNGEYKGYQLQESECPSGIEQSK